jgi:Lipocalin-like domain
MSHFSKIFFFSLALLAFSCKKDSDTDTDSSGIVGTWKLTEATCNNGTSTTTDDDGVSVTSTFTSTGKNFASTVTFKSDGTYTSGGTYTAVLSLVFAGQTIVNEVNVPEFAGSGTWKIEGNKLIVTDANGKASTGDILENTAQKFRYKINIDQTTINSGFTVTYTGTYNFSMVPQ